ncbi:MAG: hypothetical protein M0T77_07420 [Actinomycetota bacterium]|nr:hypothetical protein [Actinomycetota bacterium]
MCAGPGDDYAAETLRTRAGCGGVAVTGARALARVIERGGSACARSLLFDVRPGPVALLLGGGILGRRILGRRILGRRILGRRILGHRSLEHRFPSAPARNLLRP